MTNIKKLFLVALFMALMPSACFASLNGVKTNNVTVKLFFKRSPEWRHYVKVLTERTTSKGVLKAKNVLEGWYKPEIIKKDKKAGQSLAVKLKMLNEDGHYVKNAKVKMYMKIGGSKFYVKTVKTDKKGWIESEGLTSGNEYYLAVKNNKNEISKFSKKLDQPRIMAMAEKVGKNKEGAKWIKGIYTNTDKNQTLNVGKIQGGYYKFSLKKGDILPKGFFNVKAQILGSDTKKIKKPTLLMLYAFPQNKKTLAGKVLTSKDGEVILPKLVPNMKFQIVVMD